MELRSGRWQLKASPALGKRTAPGSGPILRPAQSPQQMELRGLAVHAGKFGAD